MVLHHWLSTRQQDMLDQGRQAAALSIPQDLSVGMDRTMKCPEAPLNIAHAQVSVGCKKILHDHIAGLQQHREASPLILVLSDA